MAKLGIFQFIDSSIEYIRNKKGFIEKVAKECDFFFNDIFKSDDRFLKASFRIKTEESIKEKILRQNYFVQGDYSKDILDAFTDIVGVRIECRFNEDEDPIYQEICNLFTIDGGEGLYRSSINEHIFLKLDEEQPQYQKNGFEIYKIDGKYVDDEGQMNFELQIKSMVNVFWGEIDHRILYKNFNYMVTEDFIRDIMYSIKGNLGMVDKQLSSLYERLKNIEESNAESTKQQLKAIISKIIHDTYIVKLRNSTGIVIDMRQMTDLIMDYLFANIQYKGDLVFEEAAILVINRIDELSKVEMSFGNFIDFDGLLGFKNKRCEDFGKGLLDAINMDFRWNMCMGIIFEISRGKPKDEFIDFVEYIVFTISYRIRRPISKLYISDIEKSRINEILQDIVLERYQKDYDINYFNLESMRNLERSVEQMLDSFESPEKILLEDKESIERILNFKMNKTIQN